MRDEIFEPEDSFYGQPVEMLEQGQRCGGHFAECRSVVVPGESSGDGPLEQRHPFLGSH